MTKRGFTMIELVMVIIVLGVLSSIAITRLSVTKDDAEVVMLANAIKEGTKEFASFAGSHSQSPLSYGDSGVWNNSNVFKTLNQKGIAIYNTPSSDVITLHILTSDNQNSDPCVEIQYHIDSSSSMEYLAVKTNLTNSQDINTSLCKGLHNLIKPQILKVRGVTLDL